MLRIEQVTRIGGVRGKYVPRAGATSPARLSRRLLPRWSLPPPAPVGSNFCLAQTGIRSALDTNEIKSGFISDPVRIWKLSSQHR